mgnify:CR=1 FL=1
MSTKETGHSRQMDKALFDFYGKPSFGQVMPLAIQHVLAMIVGCVTPSIIVAGVAGLSQKDSVILIQAALVMSALTTLLQLFPFIKTRWFAIGAGLPVMMGISFAYVPSMQAIAGEYSRRTNRRRYCCFTGWIKHQANPQVFPTIDYRNGSFCYRIIFISNCHQLHGRRCEQ